jgi:hypothetical protein
VISQSKRRFGRLRAKRLSGTSSLPSHEEDWRWNLAFGISGRVEILETLGAMRAPTPQKQVTFLFQSCATIQRFHVIRVSF